MLTLFIGDHDVLASFANEGLDRKRYRAVAKRGFHMAKLVSWIQRSLKKYQPGRFRDRVILLASQGKGPSDDDPTLIFSFFSAGVSKSLNLPISH